MPNSEIIVRFVRIFSLNHTNRHEYTGTGSDQTTSSYRQCRGFFLSISATDCHACQICHGYSRAGKIHRLGSRYSLCALWSCRTACQVYAGLFLQMVSMGHVSVSHSFWHLSAGPSAKKNVYTRIKSVFSGDGDDFLPCRISLSASQ